MIFLICENNKECVNELSLAGQETVKARNLLYCNIIPDIGRMFSCFNTCLHFPYDFFPKASSEDCVERTKFLLDKNVKIIKELINNCIDLEYEKCLDFLNTSLEIMDREEYYK